MQKRIDDNDTFEVLLAQLESLELVLGEIKAAMRPHIEVNIEEQTVVLDIPGP